MSKLKKQLEMAQAFQLELADVDWVAVMVTSGFAPVLNEGYVSVDVSTYNDSKPDQHFNLTGSEVTRQALEEMKDELRGLGYEI